MRPWLEILTFFLLGSDTVLTVLYYDAYEMIFGGSGVVE